jgi:diketogulonate reductase-like aldo/keto reductase
LVRSCAYGVMVQGMEYRRFGRTARQVPIIGQGTWYIDNGDRAAATTALRTGLDLGMTHIDTAEMYGSGAAEEMVGEAVAGRRDEVFLVSKVLPENASRRGTVLACDRSLSRLGTHRLDCYLLHWRGRFPLAETVAGFEELHREGKILTWGISNFDESDLDELWEHRTPNGPACNQVLYHLDERAIEHTVLPWCLRHGLAVVGYAPFGHGNFPGPRTRRGRVLQEIAGAHGATPRQVALRFLVRFPEVFTIPKASNPAHAAENAGAADLHLSKAELARIDEAFPVGPPRPLPVI